MWERLAILWPRVTGEGLAGTGLPERKLSRVSTWPKRCIGSCLLSPDHSIPFVLRRRG